MIRVLFLVLARLEHIFELADEDGVGILQEQVEVPEQNDGLFLQFLDGDEGFQRVVGGRGWFSGVSTRPSTALQKTRLYFEFLGDLVHFSLQPLLFWGDEVKARVTGADVVDDFGFHCCFLVDVEAFMRLKAGKTSLLRLMCATMSHRPRRRLKDGFSTCTVDRSGTSEARDRVWHFRGWGLNAYLRILPGKEFFSNISRNSLLRRVYE